jgi:hypothetical protein
MIERVIVSVHFPKAAGSSLAEDFQAHFGDNLLRDYQTDPADPLHVRNIAPHLYPLESAEIPECVRAIHGHFHPNKYLSVGSESS